MPKMMRRFSAQHSLIAIKLFYEKPASHEWTALRVALRFGCIGILSENIFHLVKEGRVSLDRLIFRRQRLCEIHHDPTLFLGKLRRSYHAHGIIKIAAGPSVRIVQSLPFYFKSCTRLGA